MLLFQRPWWPPSGQIHGHREVYFYPSILIPFLATLLPWLTSHHYISHCLPLTFSNPSALFLYLLLKGEVPQHPSLTLAYLFLLSVASPSPKRSIRRNFLKFVLGPKHFPKFRPFNDSSSPIAGSNFLCIQNPSWSGTCLYLSLTHTSHIRLQTNLNNEFLPTSLHLCLDYLAKPCSACRAS